MIVYIIAGESSGDIIGAQIISQFKSDKEFPNIKFRGIGGNKMLASGLPKSLFPMHKISIMGFVEILPHMLSIQKLIKKTINDIILTEPDIIITIDSPGFNKRVIKPIRKLYPKQKIYHLVAPTVWAYKPSRAAELAKIYDHLFVLFPFEVHYFEKENLPTTCIGHPLLERQKIEVTNDHFLNKFDINTNKPYVSITPGSRINEIKQHLPTFLKAVKLCKDLKLEIIILSANNTCKKMIQKYLDKYNFQAKIIPSMYKVQAFIISSVIIAKSGTNTLEAASISKPILIGYKLNFFSWLYIKSFVTVKYANLINIIANQEIIKEFLQYNFSPKKISREIRNLILDKDYANKQIIETKKYIEILKPKNGTSVEILVNKIKLDIKQIVN